MIKITTLKPDLDKFVLLFDKAVDRWRIAKLRNNNDGTHWITDNKMIFGVEDERFTHWQPMPENPGN